MTNVANIRDHQFEEQECLCGKVWRGKVGSNPATGCEVCYPPGVVPCDVCSLPVDENADACRHCG